MTATLLNPEKDPAVASRWVIAAMACFAAVAVLCAETLATSSDVSSSVSTATGYGQYLSDLSLLASLSVCAAALQVYRERR